MIKEMWWTLKAMPQAIGEYLILPLNRLAQYIAKKLEEDRPAAEDK
jgi:hypothetical protein